MTAAPLTTGDKRARLQQWLRSGEASLQPLTLPQRELWEATPVPVADPANHICCLIEVRGRLTALDATAAMQLVVNRQEVLRLSLLPGKEGALQMTRKTSEPNLVFRELSAAEAGPDAIEARAREVFQRPFDLVQGPLYRAEVMQRGPDDYVFAFAIHHAIGDGWTLGVFIQDLACAYAQLQLGRKEEPLPPVALSYTGWGAAERAFWQGGELERRAAFWRKSLAGAQPLWSSPPATSAPFGLDRRVEHLPAELRTALQLLARNSGATLFSTLLTSFQIALARWSGRDDFVVGTPVANRREEAVRETMGYFSGVVPLRGQVATDRSFAEMLREGHGQTMDAFAQVMPFVELVAALGVPRSPTEHPIFDVRFALQNHPIPDITLPSLTARLRMRSTGTARFHLGCEVTEQGEELEVVWLARRSVVSEDDIAELSGIFHQVLSAACRLPDAPIHTLIA